MAGEAASPYAQSHTARSLEGMATTMRVSELTRKRAAALAKDAGTTIGELVERALDTYESKQFWSQTESALAAGGVSNTEGWDAVDRDGLENE